jgi:C1A family cysteine protease
MKTTQRKYGWKKSKDDVRDYHFGRMVSLKKLLFRDLPPVVSNIQWCSPVEDQGQLGSCTSNAWAGLLQYNENKNNQNGSGSYNDLSRLFIYYNERVIEGTVSQDSGAELRDGAKALADQGVCIESEWPYIEANFTQMPSSQCYTDALPNVIHSYYSLNTITDMKTCLANGQCFVFGFNVYDYFESSEMASTGILKMPQPNEQAIGGHAVMAVGYDDTQQTFLIRNSWGTGWGLNDNGYFMMPYSYITNQNLASDFWTVVKDI